MRRVLILGGTGEAVAIARMLYDEMADRVEAISALAGVTQSRAPIPGTVRVGGFGGVDGLVEYIQAERIDVLIDATHPFAAQMAAQGDAAEDHPAHVAA
jgi:precorrin-6A/cobalt-precorrin-6A reductase